MRRITVTEASPDMVLARTIFSMDGRVLLNAGVRISQRYIDRLQQIGIAYLYIVDESLGDIEYSHGLVSEETVFEAMLTVRNSFDDLSNRRQINVQQIKDTVDLLISEIMMNHDALHGLSAICIHDDYTYAHSVDVCLLSLVIGLTLHMDRDNLRNLGVGAMLHDIGKTRISQDLLNKTDPLSCQEYDQIKLHCEYGFEIMRSYKEISLLSAHVAYQHHESWDGSGYPRGLKGADIQELARITAVTDAYDAMLGTRPYREAYSVPDALETITGMAGQKFDPRVINALLANVSVYPTGTVVELNTGHFAIVVRCYRDDPARPMIRLLFTTHPLERIPPREIDLRVMRTIRINRVLHDDEVNTLLRRS